MSLRKHLQSGLSLIELMIALAIGALLIAGAVQVFSASRAAYMISEGMARVQENGRFALDFLQRDIRMAGHFGCVNDQAHFRNVPVGLQTTFGIAPHPGIDFSVSIQGYEASGTSPSSSLTISESPDVGGTYSPSLPFNIDNATDNRVAGSDIIALRFLAPEGVPVTAIGGTPSEPVFHFDPARWDVLRSGVSSPGLFGVADCLGTTIFHAGSVDPGAGTVTFAAGSGVNAPSVGVDQVFTAGQATIFRAESVVYYVGLTGAGSTALYRVRFHAPPGGALTADTQELVEGVENIQAIYGVDRELNPSVSPTGYIDRQLIASDAALGVGQEGWRRAGAVHVALLASSPDRAAVAQPSELGAGLVGAGVSFQPPEDGRYRAVYQSTIALRNRLYGN